MIFRVTEGRSFLFAFVTVIMFGVTSIAGAAHGLMYSLIPPTDDEALEQWLQRTIADMTIAEKVGQLFVPYVYGQSIHDDHPDNVSRNRAYAGTDNFAELIEKYHVGGIILAGWAGNFVTLEQTIALTHDIQQVAMSQRLPIPLLLGADAESAAPLRNVTTSFPGNMAFGAVGDEELAYKAAQTIGRELKAIGINQNYAPVADVNVNPANPVIGLRSFGSDSDLVAALTVAQTKGYQDVGVVATAKHFPGHGNTDVDSHVGLPIIYHSLEQLWEIDLKPFQAAIDAGLDAMMTAHIVVPALDASGRPATLSKPILTDLLRETMGFDGVILTDALNMQGVREMFGDDRVAVEAVLAGVDLLLFPMNMTIQYNAVLEAVERGEITETRLDESVYRLLKLKAKRGLFDEAFMSMSIGDSKADGNAQTDLVGSNAHRAIAQTVAERSITLVKNDRRVLPLKEPAETKVFVTGPNIAPLVSALQEAGATTQQLQTSANPDEEAINRAVASSGNSDVIIVLTSNATAAQAALVNALRDTGIPVITVATSRPYDINAYPDAETHLVTFGSHPDTMKALPDVLFGRINPSGRLPVSIPARNEPSNTLFPFGHGLTEPLGLADSH